MRYAARTDSSQRAIVVDLPWPAKELNPNRRVFWRRVAQHRKAQREAAHYATLAALPAEVRRSLGRKRPLPVRIEFVPPNRMRAVCEADLRGAAEREARAA